MANNTDTQVMTQELEAQLKLLRAVVYETMEKIAHTCASVSPDIVKQIISSVFMAPVTAMMSQNVAVAAPAVATDTPSPKPVEKGKRGGRKAVWSQSSDKAIRLAIYRRLKDGADIEPELEAEAVKRLPTYDAKTHHFTGKPYGMQKRRTDWANSSDNAIRNAISNRLRKGRDIEPELNEEAAKRFKFYNPVMHTFNGKGRGRCKTNASVARPVNTVAAVKTPKEAPVKKPAVAPIASVAANEILAMTHLSVGKSMAGNYMLRFNDEKMLLKGAALPYELVLFDKKTKMAIVRKKGADADYRLYIIKCDKGQILKEMKKGARDIKYIPATHQLFAREVIEAIQRYIVFTPGAEIEYRKIITEPNNSLSVSARQISTETFVIEEDGSVTRYQLMNIAKPNSAAVKIETPAQVDAPVVKAEPAPQPVKKPVVTPRAALNTDDIDQEVADILRNLDKGMPFIPVQPDAAAPKKQTEKLTGELKVTVKPVKKKSKYNDVFVNDKCILHNHIGTMPRVFLNGSILAVHGIVTGDPDMPEVPSWQVFDTGLKPRQFSQRQSITRKKLYIKNILTAGDDRIILEVGNSNNMRLIIDARPTQAVFKIMSENER